jgi:hypothetical protein
MDDTKENINNAIDKVKDHVTDDNGKPKITLIITVFLIMLVGYLIMYYYRLAKFSPYLIMAPEATSRNNNNISFTGKNIPDSIYSNEYSYSMWLYISGENKSNMDEEKKVILYRKNGTSNKYSMIYMVDVKKDKLLIRHALTTTNDATFENMVNLDDNVLECDIENVPYNNFFHLAVVLYGKSIVVYINGIMVRTNTHNSQLSTLNTSDKIESDKISNSSVYIGWISKLRYFVDVSKENGGALNDKQVYDLYLNSPYPSLFQNVVHSILHKVVTFSGDSKEESYDTTALTAAFSGPTSSSGTSSGTGL